MTIMFAVEFRRQLNLFIGFMKLVTLAEFVVFVLWGIATGPHSIEFYLIG